MSDKAKPLKNATQIPMVDLEGNRKQRWKRAHVKGFTTRKEMPEVQELPDCPFCLREQTRRAPRKVRRGPFGEPLTECVLHMDKGEQGTLL